MTRDRPAPPLADELAAVRELLQRLADEVQVLRQVLDELRDDVAWGLNNGAFTGHSRLPPYVVTSMPLDPCSRDWQLNRRTAANVSPDSSPPLSPRSTLFD